MERRLVAAEAVEFCSKLTLVRGNSGNSDLYVSAVIGITTASRPGKWRGAPKEILMSALSGSSAISLLSVLLLPFNALFAFSIISIAFVKRY